MEIARKGFGELNLVVSTNLIRTLARESSGNPHLMQKFCAELCYANRVEGAVATHQKLMLKNKEKFFTQIAEQWDPFAVTQFLNMRGSWSERKRREFIDGRKGDIFVVVLTALARRLPATTIGQSELLQEIDAIVKKGKPQKHEVTRVVEKISDEALRLTERQPVVEWDKQTKEFHIIDPFFAFNLKWGNWPAGPRRSEQ